MPEDYFDHKRKELYAEHEEMLFKLAMMEYAEEHGQELAARAEELERNNDHALTPETLRKFNKIIDRMFFRKRLGNLSRGATRFLPRVAAAIAIIAILFSTLVMSVEAVRVSTLNFLINVQNGYTSIHQDPSGSGSLSGDITLTNTYMPSYIPEGYSVSALNNGKSFMIITYENDMGHIIYFQEYSGSGANIDTEEAEKIESVKVNGQEGMLVEKDGIFSVTWKLNDRFFVVATEISADESVRIAESVIFIK